MAGVCSGPALPMFRTVPGFHGLHPRPESRNRLAGLATGLCWRVTPRAFHAKTHPPTLPDTLSIPPETDIIIPAWCLEEPKNLESWVTRARKAILQVRTQAWGRQCLEARPGNLMPSQHPPDCPPRPLGPGLKGTQGDTGRRSRPLLASPGTRSGIDDAPTTSKPGTALSPPSGT